jgi:hypothetical protein
VKKTDETKSQSNIRDAKEKNSTHIPTIGIIYNSKNCNHNTSTRDITSESGQGEKGNRKKGSNKDNNNSNNNHRGAVEEGGRGGERKRIEKGNEEKRAQNKKVFASFRILRFLSCFVL